MALRLTLASEKPAASEGNVGSAPWARRGSHLQQALELANLVKRSHKLGSVDCTFPGRTLFEVLTAFIAQASASPVAFPQASLAPTPRPWANWAAPILRVVRPGPTLAGVGWVREFPASLGHWLAQDSLVDPLRGQGRPQPRRNNHGTLRTSELPLSTALEACRP